MIKLKRILVLYAKYGNRHLSIANSIQTYIENHYFYNSEVKCADCVEYMSPFLSSIILDTYKKNTNKTPKLLNKLFYDSKKGVRFYINTKLKEKMAKNLHRLFREFLPDVVISTHPFATQMTSYLIEHEKINCELATILTDFTLSEQWLIGKDYCDYFFVSNDIMRQVLIASYDIPAEKIFVTGIPLSNTFSYPFYDDEIYQNYRLNKNKKTILFLGDEDFGLAQKRTALILESLANHLDKYQIVAISGNNKKMNNEFLKLYDKIKNDDLHILKYTKDVPDLMHISSLIVTTSDGLTSSESLASNLPMLITPPVSVQEVENAEFLENSGVAVWLKEDDDIDKIVNDILNNKEKLEKMKRKCKLIARPNSTMDICQTILGKIC